MVRTKVSELTSTDEAEACALVKRFQNVDEHYFLEALRRNREVIRFRDAARGELVGVAVIDVVERRLPNGTKAVALFTSSVVVDPRYRGKNLLQKAGLDTYLRTLLKYPACPIYWHFDTFSYKSYLVMARNLEVYWPRPDAKAPPHVRALVDGLSRERYGDAWDSGRWIARASGRKRPRQSAAPIGIRELEDPLIRSFAILNPHHQDGDRLVCFAPLTIGNWRSILSRAVTRALRPARATQGVKTVV